MGYGSGSGAGSNSSSSCSSSNADDSVALFVVFVQSRLSVRRLGWTTVSRDIFYKTRVKAFQLIYFLLDKTIQSPSLASYFVSCIKAFKIVSD